MHPRFVPECVRRLLDARPRDLTRMAARLLAVCFAAVLPVDASIYVQQMKLDGLCAKADRIIRGTVVDVTRGEVKAGGGSLPTITYRFKVKDTVVGNPAEIVDLTMIAEPKAPVVSGHARRESLMELPELKEGKEYLLFTTKPSKIGLSSPVGLAQGCFAITTKGDKEFALNGANNAGLGLPTAGPVEYQELVKKIRALRPN